MRVVAALAEGLGIRAVARVFEVDPNTGNRTKEVRKIVSAAV
jgi:hypothetical protein